MSTPAMLLRLVGCLTIVLGVYGIFRNLSGANAPIEQLLNNLELSESQRFVLTGERMADIFLPPLIGIPVGIWSLIVLNKPEVKSAFRPSAHKSA